MVFLKFFKPMLLSERSQAFDDDKFLYELKYDGYRATIHVSPKTIKVYSRNGIDLTSNFPELKSIKGLVKHETIFDGEIVSFLNGKPSFSDLQVRGRIKSKYKIEEKALENPVVFVAFDCLYEDGEDLTHFDLLKRKKILEKFGTNDNFILSSYSIGQGKSLFKKVKKLDLEGIVAKRIDSEYVPEVRTKDWIKIKNYKCESFFIGGFIDTQFKRSLLLGEYRSDGKLYFVGKVSVDKLKVFDNKVYSRSPFCNYKEKEINYFKKLSKCEVIYIERTPNGNLREPVFKRMVENG